MRKIYKIWKYRVIIKSLNISYFCAVLISKSLTDFCHGSVPHPELPALNCAPVTRHRKVKFKKKKHQLSQTIIATLRNNNEVLFLALQQKEKMSLLGIFNVTGLLLIRREIIAASIQLVQVHFIYPWNTYVEVI